MSEDMTRLGIEWLKADLHEGVMIVTFTKKDGSERVMTCTTRVDLIPVALRWKTPPQVPVPLVTETVVPPGPVDHLFVVFDLENEGYRSFRYSTIKTLRK